jgi:hypothetical protein
MEVIRLKIGLWGSGNSNYKYLAEVIKDRGKYHYRVGEKEIEITQLEYNSIIKNPHLYYFSTALKLHFLINKKLKS